MVKPILLYGAPVWSNAHKTNLKKLEILENKTLRMISGLDPRISNIQIKSKLNIHSISKDIYDQTKMFYEIRVKAHQILENLGKYNTNNAPFKIKYKLPHQILIDKDDK